MSGDGAAAAADLADALEAFADQAAEPGSEREIWVTIGTQHDIEQRTVAITVNVADWVGELLRAEADILDRGLADPDPDDADGPGTETWWG
ncbi:hypothetical protein ACFVFS_37775 [Kitasatospora sp. NPDC057692]|uniref:hypothetical protein n=1 Tax=Kitasatospora sp. NPDC057692 TaxID=3346215 RepID=UPI00369C8229